MPTILVTAGSGSAGRNCVEALLSECFDVVTTAREVRDLSFSRDVEVRSYDADGGTDFDVLLKGIDAVVLIGPPLDGRIDKKACAIHRSSGQNENPAPLSISRAITSQA